VFWPLQSRSEFLGVMEDSQVAFSGMWVATSHFPQNGVATRAVETVFCRSSALSPSSDRSQESLVFHNYPDLESSPGTLVYLPSWFQLWDSVSARHPAREGWRAISLLRIWASSGGWSLRLADRDLTQARAISSCNNNQHPHRFIPYRDIKMVTEEDTWATNIKKELQERPRNPNRDDLDQFEQ
jgi:hypothetical protein